MRLARYLAQSGVAARRKAETLIRAGVVAVNGKKVTDVATNVDAGRDRVSVEGKAVHPEDSFYVVLNKPKGCITAVSDPWDRPVVTDYLPRLPSSVVPVGRLDFYSEGVLLLTNDGELAAAILSPRSRIEKTYHVKVRGRVSDRHLHALRTGVRIERAVTREASVDRLHAKSKHEWLVITLTEGKSRQIHRMMSALGHTVLKLQRVAFAGLTFHGLRVGDARELTQTEVNELRALAGLKRDPSAVGRGKWGAKREQTDRGRRARAKARAEAAGEEGRTPVAAKKAPRSRPSGRRKGGKTKAPSTRRGRGRGRR